ncbi:hypothetical protein INT47_008087, partial [Mucor saturninus]
TLVAPTSMSDIHLSLQQLKRLTILSKQQTTAIVIKYHSTETLQLQLDAISKQQNFLTPQDIHIVCESEKEKEELDGYSVTVNGNKNWFNHIKPDVKSDFYIVIDNGVIPGHGYFNFVLGLLNTPLFHHSLLGTEQEFTNICQQDQAYSVTSISDIWVLRREWFNTLVSQESDNISDVLSLPSILLPTSDSDYQLKGNTENACINVDGGILFYKDKQSDALDEMICNFAAKNLVHLVSTNGISCHHDAVIIHHDTQDSDRLVSKISPRVVIYEEAHDMPTFENTTVIALPTKDIPLVSPWITDLSVDTLEQWHTPQINLIVEVGGKRSDKAKKLFSGLKKAHYMGDRVDLSVVMDEKSDQKTIKAVNGFEWKKGVKNIRHRISGVHPMQIFAEAWYPSNDHEYAVMLDDRIELSNSFYIWLKYNVLKYRYQQQTSSSLLFGISLYSPRIIDTDPSGRQLLIPAKEHSPYLMQAPCSFGGALYFPEHWREFHDYISARLTDQATVKRGSGKLHLFKDSLLTVAKSNKWLSSWRKYFDEMIYMRGYVMLYPSFGSSYSTVTSITRNKKKQGLYELAEKLYNVPSTDIVRELPDLEFLPVLDLHGKQVDKTVLTQRGHQLQQKFSACAPNKNNKHDPSDMLCPFNQLVQVPIDQTSVPTTTIYVG